eukprot:3928765-Rhodomonas_salina.2
MASMTGCSSAYIGSFSLASYTHHTLCQYQLLPSVLYPSYALSVLRTRALCPPYATCSLPTLFQCHSPRHIASP